MQKQSQKTKTTTKQKTKNKTNKLTNKQKLNDLLNHLHTIFIEKHTLSSEKKKTSKSVVLHFKDFDTTKQTKYTVELLSTYNSLFPNIKKKTDILLLF